MIRVSNIKLGIDKSDNDLLKKISKKLRIDIKDIEGFKIFKRSLDARKKPDIFYVYTVDIKTNNEYSILKKVKDKDIAKAEYYEYVYPDIAVEANSRPVIVGFGPAGIFCSLMLARMGLNPIVFERGKNVDERTKDVEKFWNEGILNINSNVQFGEGGAGTFSDGKLTSRSKDLRVGEVLKIFSEHGGPEEILYVHNPHLGTDKLKGIVKSIREEILSLGGEIRFNSIVTDIVVDNGSIKKVTINNKESILSDDIVFAIGHSSRDTVRMLFDKGVDMAAKSFAVGLRIEHKQQNIDKEQFGDSRTSSIVGSAEYKLTSKDSTGRGVYTFCMCPGGRVVAASSEKGTVVTNGMSYYDRGLNNANSAILVQVFPEDLESHTLAGIDFQRSLEEKAFEIGGSNYNAPFQTVGEYLGRDTEEESEGVRCSYKPGVVSSDISKIFPDFINKSLKESILNMGKKIKGFDDSRAVLTAVETRSSSPVRILRKTETYECININGLYPIGEGAGYSGGIVSSAIDGIVTAEKIYEKYKSDKSNKSNKSDKSDKI